MRRDKWTLSRWKKEFDKIFSRYVRLKYSKNGYATCYTCGKVNEIKKLQNGHYISRSYLSTRFDEENCRVQCYGCNVMQQGKSVDFREHLVRDLGEKKVLALEQRRFQIVKYEITFYKEKIEHYQERIKHYENI